MMPLDGVMHLLSYPRANGKTTIIARAAQAAGRDAVLICANRREMQRIKAEYPGEYQVKTIDNPIYDLVGRRGEVILFDHFAMAQILDHHWHIYEEAMVDLARFKDEAASRAENEKRLRAQIRELKKPEKKKRKKEKRQRS
jgi:hypothetical protein